MSSQQLTVQGLQKLQHCRLWGMWPKMCFSTDCRLHEQQR